MEAIVRIPVKVERLVADSFEDKKTKEEVKYFQMIENGGIVEVKYKLTEAMYKEMKKEKVEGKVIEIALKRKVATDNFGNLANFVGNKVLSFMTL